DGIRDDLVTGVQTCALPIFLELVEDDDVVRRKRIRIDVREVVRSATEARRGDREHAIRPRGPEQRAEISVADPERPRERVIEAELALVVPPHRLLATVVRDD